MEHISISISVDYYKKKELKKLINSLMKSNNVNIIVRALSSILFGLIGTVIETPPINKKACRELSSILANKLYSSDKNDISIDKIHLKKGANSLKLQVEIKEIDIEAAIDKILIDVYGKQDRKSSNKTNDVVFGILSSLNESISSQEKCRLVQLLLNWLNDNNVITEVFDELSEAQGILPENIKALQLKIGNINLDY